MARKPKETEALPSPPAGFRVNRELPLGRHPILTAFPGLERMDTAKRHEPNATARRKLHADTLVELVADDLWMYVAPWSTPKGVGRWKPVVTPQVDCIVIGESHLRTSDELILWLDIFHELCHIRQRHAGRRLFDRRYSYVRSPTEVEAYRFVIDEARRFQVKESILREYLLVEWIDESEYHELLDTMGVARA
ncbi:MAG: hypothetical protein L3K19_05855 [Thermoplasmata archaeon]|nr:hypothetical protein [Thermoplasmata archaeon]